MTYEYILVEVEAGVVEITLNNPDKFNALNTATAKEIIQVIKMVKSR